MVSYLTLVNRILRRLRESAVTTVTATPYSTLVGQFINDAKREVEDAWQWAVLLKSFTVSTTANSSAIIPWPDTLSPRARLAIDPNRNQSLSGVAAPSVARLDVTDVNTFLTDRMSADLAPFYSFPTSVNLVRNPSVLDQEERNPFAWQLWPYPDSVYDITTYVIDPQPDLSLETDILLVPAAPVEMRAYLYLLYERGEELGEYIGVVAKKAEDALSDSIALDHLQNWPSIEFHL